MTVVIISKQKKENTKKIYKISKRENNVMGEKKHIFVVREENQGQTKFHYTFRVACLKLLIPKNLSNY